MHHEDLADRWRAFGWHVIAADGHDPESLNRAFEEAGTIKGRPSIVIATTIKGYGSTLMENKASWHHHLPDADEYRQIISDLEQRKEAASYE